MASNSYRTCAVNWVRGHRRLAVSATLVVIVLSVALEVGVRIITPDAMEIVEYSYVVPHHVVYDQMVANPVEAIDTYHSLTRTAAAWNTFNPQYGGFEYCEGSHLLTSLPDTSNQPLVLRFLWHGIPIAVASHAPASNGSGGLWACGPDEWQVSAGGVPNPRPYFNDDAFQWFP
jgi:hypothetical protein